MTPSAISSSPTNNTTPEVASQPLTERTASSQETATTKAPTGQSAPSIARAGMGPPPARAGSRAARAVARPSPPEPALLRLPAGTRLWIQTNSVNREPDGSFTFRSSLLLPMGEANATPLYRGTEVYGSGSANQSRVALSITEFVVAGAHYKLKGVPNVTNAQTSGTGATVAFDAGQVLEIFLASDSIYERVPEADQSEPRP